MTTPPKTLGFPEECELLATLETFDPEAFRGDDKVPQAVCNFVLALALIYNDCKDVIYAHVALSQFKLHGPRQRTKVYGAIAGAESHAFRAVAGLLHELFTLIQANDDVLRDDFFLSVVRQLHPNSRKAWAALVDVARGATPTDKLGQRLLLIRNKVFFHYDPKAIFVGYTEHFLGPKKRDDRAYLSRGVSMRTTRFFFADAAADGYLDSVMGSERAGALMGETAEVVGRINASLFLMVGKFIQRRGYAFRREAEP
jgi:hypothetical protein